MTIESLKRLVEKSGESYEKYAESIGVSDRQKLWYWLHKSRVFKEFVRALLMIRRKERQSPDEFVTMLENELLSKKERQSR